GISVAGADAANYNANPTATTTANITARSLAVSAQGIDKVYDGTSVAAVSLSDEPLPGDGLNDIFANAAFPYKKVGFLKTISVSGIAGSGADAANYTANAAAGTSANITTRPLAVTAQGVNKVYDGTTTATVTLSDNRVVGDALAETYISAAFADKNLGSG